jgi:hypothetical protein
MDADVGVFWDNVRTAVRQQNTTYEWVAKKVGINFNTFMGWITKGIYPRADDAVRIGTVLNTSVERLVTGTMREWDNTEAVKRVSAEVSHLYRHLDALTKAVEEL